MQFHESIAYYNLSRKARLLEAHQTPAGTWYERQLAMALRRGVPKDPRAAHIIWRMGLERDWFAENRPYYNVWPVAERALTRLRLDAVDSGMVRLPLKAMLIRFAVDHEVSLFDGRKMWSVLAGNARMNRGGDGIALMVDIGQRQIVDGAEDALLQTRTFSIEPGKSVEEALRVPVDESDATTDLSKADEFFMPAIRLLSTLCLLEQDPNLIEPDVLADDRRRYEETRDAALVARAVRRGKRGWNIGAHLDVSPHWRRPHFALRWTGPSGKVPRIVPVKGAIVRLTALKQVPTGTMADDDGIAYED